VLGEPGRLAGGKADTAKIAVRQESTESLAYASANKYLINLTFRNITLQWVGSLIISTGFPEFPS
jgi:hypothetical protein